VAIGWKKRYNDESCDYGIGCCNIGPRILAFFCEVVIMKSKRYLVLVVIVVVAGLAGGQTFVGYAQG
jgi:hypothetical protein